MEATATLKAVIKMLRTLYLDAAIIDVAATAFGTRKGQKRSGKVPEKMRQRCHFLYTDI